MSSAWSLDELRAVIRRHWGYDSFRPLQQQAMTAVLDGRDSLVVLPTGGGKSLCYQAPAVLRGDTTVVISPLISLMKDQVDGLRACGVNAVQIDSAQSPAERAECERAIAAGEVRLLFASPERLMTSNFQRLLSLVRVRTFAIDEAHCISHWGHDFRPEYRQLKRLKELFPGVTVHGYTATATEQVRRDISQQLQLDQPEVLVGNFDRPNLTYRVLPRQNELAQVREVLERHKGEAGIIYCLRRKDVDTVTDWLRDHKFQAMPYHAGLDPEQRHATQNAFADEQCDLVVATVAFGMGIDRSNIRFVLHTGMPKSVEHYQQETGRAGRDGLEAECVLLHSGDDYRTWKYLIEKSAEEAAADPRYVQSALRHLNDM
ncbi:MAG: ATP-dependent DNA helicase RecQ, partial [Gemmataceae bacterium]